MSKHLVLLACGLNRPAGPSRRGAPAMPDLPPTQRLRHEHHVHVVGVGMIPFVKPCANKPYPAMAAAALRRALADAGIGYEQV